MHESPSSAQLLQAVIAFLNTVVTPKLSGHDQFHARVSANALALVAREIEHRQAADASATTLYCTLLDHDLNETPDLAALEAKLCDAIRNGQMDHETPHLLASLRRVARAQLAIDQPNYSGLKA
jgi:Domain of unknown function (DUF6285)